VSVLAEKIGARSHLTAAKPKKLSFSTKTRIGGTNLPDGGEA